jgi:signal transduction histidine kinase
MVFKNDVFALQGLLIEAVKDTQKRTKKHRIILKSKVKNINVYGDKFRIYQVVTNLLNNAIKYSPNGGKIIVDMKSSGKNTVVSVKDNGIGINKNQLKRVFERLYQVPGGVEQTYPGMGMGLYIANQIIKNHKGKIWVESIIGRGSTFYFSIPKYK